MKPMLLFFVYFILFINCVQCQPGFLYNATDNKIISLAADNFTSTIENKENAWFVQFYKHWCPHCKNFAPIWKTLADDIFSWQPLVKLAVIDCALEINSGTCRSAKIKFVPTLFYYKPFWNFSINQRAVFVPKNTSNVLRTNLINLLTNTTKPSNNWPHLDFINPTNQRAELNKIALTKKVYLIAESEESTVGREVILDFAKHQDKVIIKRVNWRENTLNQLDLDENKIPALVILPKRGVVPILVANASQLGSNPRKVLGDIIRKTIGLKINLKEHLDVVPINEKKKPLIVNDNRLYMADLYKGLHQIMTSEILVYDVFASKELNPLKNFLHLLNRYWPHGKSDVKGFAKSLLNWINEQSVDQQGIAVGSLLKQIKLFLNQYKIPNPNEWVTCRGSDPSYRGYTCSVWILWHTLTVNEYLEADRKLTKHEVAFGMREFIGNFFSCYECQSHFMNETVNIAKEIDENEATSSIRWLWNQHNSVNKRIAGDQTEDPSFPKILFPSPKSCSKCWNHGQFNEKQVINYLIDRYRTSSWVN